MYIYIIYILYIYIYIYCFVALSRLGRSMVIPTECSNQQALVKERKCIN